MEKDAPGKAHGEDSLFPTGEKHKTAPTTGLVGLCFPKTHGAFCCPLQYTTHVDFYLNTFSDIMGPKIYDLKMGNISMKGGKCFKPNVSLHEVMGEIQISIKQCILFHLFVYYY